MEIETYSELVKETLDELFHKAREEDELSFLFAILGINSGVQDTGWEPISETQNVIHDIIGLINSPLQQHSKTRLALFLYSHITEANFLYHCLFNMLLTVEGEPPRAFNFLNSYRNGIPPPVKVKINEINRKSQELECIGITTVLDEIFNAKIRNAFFHSDYILYNNELRLKHRGNQIEIIPIDDVFVLLEKTLSYYNTFFDTLMEARKSFPLGYVIEGRTNALAQPLADINVIIDEPSGMATGFSTANPMPIW